MPYDKETEEKIRLDKIEQEKQWQEMSEAEREKIRIASRSFAKKVDSCYPEKGIKE